MRWLESLAAEAPSLDAYLREIARFPELTGAEERRLSERARRRDDDAVAQLAASQLGLVLRYAQKYRHLGVSLVDLHSKNGTWVGGARLEPGARRWLQPMDRLKLGRVQAFTCLPGVLRGILRHELRSLF